MLTELDFTGKSVVVTGAANGMGRATCEVFAELGARVFGIDVEEGFEAPFETALPSATAIHADATNESEVAAARDAVAAEVDALAAVVNIVGGSGRSAIGEMTLEEWESVLRLTLTSAFLVTTAFLSLVKAGSGAFVNMASTHAFTGLPFGVSYSASKAGVVGLTRTLAVELGPTGVRVNCVCPGPVATRRLAGHNTASAASTVIGRAAEPREIANAIVFLASPAASFITGSALMIDGGQSAHRGVVDDSRSRAAASA